MHGYHSRWLARREGSIESTMHLTWEKTAAEGMSCIHANRAGNTKR